MATIIHRTDPQWERAETYCRKHFGNSVEELGWEGHLHDALVRGEDPEAVCTELGEEYGLDDLTMARSFGWPWQ